MLTAANFLRNRMYNNACSTDKKTPYEAIIGKKPNLSHNRRLGAVLYVHVPKERRKSKFQARATTDVHVRCHHGNNYKVRFPVNRKVVSSRHVIFDEMCHHDSITEPSNDQKMETGANRDDDTDSSRSNGDKDGSISPHQQESGSPGPFLR